jgi:hypothetical protein
MEVWRTTRSSAALLYTASMGCNGVKHLDICASAAGPGKPKIMLRQTTQTPQVIFSLTPTCDESSLKAEAIEISF